MLILHILKFNIIFYENIKNSKINLVFYEIKDMVVDILIKDLTYHKYCKFKNMVETIKLN